MQELARAKKVSEQEFELRSEVDGFPLHGYRFATARPCEASVVIVHGAAEHAARYARFAEHLGAHGLEAWALDHRGHGKSPGPGGLGDIGRGGWDGLVADIAQLVGVARAANPERPLAVFGHSMGAFATQHFCIEYSELADAVVLSGSTAFDFPDDMRELPEFEPNAFFEPARTPYDWLSRDEAEVDKYMSDPLCGFEAVKPVFTIDDLRRLSDQGALARIRDDLPVLLLAGDKDPLNLGLWGMRRLEEKLREAGVKQIDSRFYEGGRHEMLNELNRDQVMADVVTWLQSVLRSDAVRHSYIRPRSQP